MANPLSGKIKGARYSRSRTDTMIGAGVRVEGNLTFTGVLRIDGNVLGDVSCDLDSNGTIVVGESGNITGTTKAPHIVVSGRIYGAVHSSESIEIQQGACVVGNVFYKAIVIHAGGAIEGSLAPKVSIDRGRVGQEYRSQGSEPLAVKESDMPLANADPAGSRIRVRFGGVRTLGVATTLFIAVAAVVWANRYPAPISPPVADVALKADAPMNGAPTAQSARAGSIDMQEGQRAVTTEHAPLLSISNADSKSVVEASSPHPPEMDEEKVVAVQGVNSGKPADGFAVICKEPCVLFKKKRHDSADGTRINVSQGATVSIPIAKNEIFRVEKGRDIEIFYQGRKVAPKNIESGAWISFVPQSPSAASDKKKGRGRNRG